MTGLIVDVHVNCMPCQMQVTNRFVILFPWEQNLKNRNFKVLFKITGIRYTNAYTHHAKCGYTYQRMYLSMKLQHFVGVAGVYVYAFDTGKCMRLYP